MPRGPTTMPGSPPELVLVLLSVFSYVGFFFAPIPEPKLLIAKFIFSLGALIDLEIPSLKDIAEVSTSKIWTREDNIFSDIIVRVL